jgi:hypothetical protein
MSLPTYVLLASLLPIAGCASSDSTEPDPSPEVNSYFAAPDPSEGFQVGLTVNAPAGEEIWECLVLDGLPTEEQFSLINYAEHKQTGFVHHMDLMALAYTDTNFEPGRYNCKDLYDDHAQTLMDDGIILYASQVASEIVQLPEGIVAEVPTATKFLYEVHFVNSSDTDIEVKSYLNGYTIPALDVKGTIWGGPVRDRNINVPAVTDNHVEWTRCVMTDDVDVVFLSSHTHELAKKFQIRSFDGTTVGEELLYENLAWESPHLEHFDPPMHVKKGEGFEFQCHYASDRPEDTKWGLTAIDEMCQIAVVFTPGKASTRCEVVETSDGVILE